MDGNDTGNNNSQKLDNQLNLALSVDNEVREKSLNLDTGYLENNRWELIIRYVGSLERLYNMGVEVTELLNNYAIIIIDENLIDVIAGMDEIIYIEKPKNLYYEVVNAIRNSCISPVQSQYGTYGEGVLVAVIDSGIDYKNTVFRDRSGKTRIEYIWDQTDNSGTPPEGYDRGTLYTKEDIDNAISTGVSLRTRDLSGHGTAVASVAAGNFADSKTGNVGIATKSQIIAVKLGNPFRNSFPKTSELMQAIDFSVRKSLELNMPIVINISFGNNYGSHDGTSLIEQYINSVSGIGRNSIVIGMGNEGASAGHYTGKVENNKRYEVQVAVGEFEPTLNIQMWKNYSDEFLIEFISPSGRSTGTLGVTGVSTRYQLGATNIYVYYGEPTPFSVAQEIYIDLIPRDTYIESGIYRIIITPLKITTGEFDMWLPVESAINDTRFLGASPEVTITTPATVVNAISVGAYNSYTGAYADFSGRGYLRENNLIKPDIVAPGVNIRAATATGTELFSGTSFATPVVSGSVALMMEWGIVRGNDLYLYGEKVKAYLIRGAVPLAGEEVPSRKTGWGALCLRNSIPI